MVKLPNLDALRFFLAFCVLIFHLPALSKNQGLPYFNALPIFNRGYEAVCMFFVLSGFLIIRIIYRNKKQENFSIKKFYIRRVLRIFPLYFLVVVFGFLFYQFILPMLNIPFINNYDLIDGVLLTTFFLPNVFAFKYEPGGILEVLWSIGIEEQFYLIIAPILYVLNRKYILITLLLITAMYFVIYHSSYMAILRTYFFVYFFLLFGGITAILEAHKKLEFLKKHIIFPILIFVLTLLYFFTNVLSFSSVLFYNLFTSILFGLFIHTISFNHQNILVKNKLINYLGKISYGIYLYHVIVLNIVVFVFVKLKPLNVFNDIMIIIAVNILTLGLTILMAHISYKHYEKPFLKLKSKFR